jgi:hypothetical protein
LSSPIAIEDLEIGQATLSGAGLIKRDIMKPITNQDDPDYGLELRPEAEAELRESLKRKEKGIPLEAVVKEESFQGQTLKAKHITTF